MTWTDTAYANVDMVESSLQYLGVDNVRDAAPPDWLSQPFDQLADAGVDFDFLIPVNDGETKLYGSIDRMADFEDAHPGSINSIEGPNEVNYSPAPWNGSTSLQAEADLQHDLYNAVQDNATLSDIPVANLTLAGVGSSSYAPLGDLSDATDLGNAHIYFPDGEQPSNIWDQALATGETPTPSETAIVTESGYYSMPDHDRGVSETVQAKSTLNLLMDAAESGTQTTYLYQLLDHAEDSGSDPELHYGLFNPDGSAKPVADAIHNLTTILDDHSGNATSADASFDYSFSGAPDSAHEMAMTAGDGTTDIVVWDEPQIWDSDTASAVQADTHDVTLSLASGEADFTVYDPMTGSEQVASADDSGNVTFSLSDHPVIINVDEASSANQTASASNGTGTTTTGTGNATTGSTGSGQAGNVSAQVPPTSTDDSGSNNGSTTGNDDHASASAGDDSGSGDDQQASGGSSTDDSGSSGNQASGSDASSSGNGGTTVADGSSSTDDGTHTADGSTSQGASDDGAATGSDAGTDDGSSADAGNAGSHSGSGLPWMSGDAGDWQGALDWARNAVHSHDWSDLADRMTHGDGSDVQNLLDHVSSDQAGGDESGSTDHGSHAFDFDQIHNFVDHHLADWGFAA
ncbi:hypothetical protein [Pararhizobium mangrovi]|uniref:Uncharacterized protein n=1 Tax=Pararhizobium mangrovi TaxID=2590452 RepID=A0A506U3S2_9HYPH|nr:hypothetical protein [Pararhizobium mangrovi]TPW27941.1 hypothetical protein FJU11_10375 [Pararhizobium mangrovi]